MKFRIAFQNCHNLFDVGNTRANSPKTAQGLADKIENLAATLRAVSGGALPEIVALCEAGTEALGQQVGFALAPRFYRSLWSGTSAITQTGLQVLYNPATVVPITVVVDASLQTLRPHWMAVQFQLRVGSRIPFWMVVNHWKSNRGGADSAETARIRSAGQLGRFYLEYARNLSESMVMVGDFNCEPGASAFRKTRNFLKASREREIVFRGQTRIAHFYNPMWRFYGEAEDYETARLYNYHTSRPAGTFCVLDKEVGWVLWDQMMVTKSLLKGGKLRFVESSLTVSKPHQRSSDHCALAAEFECQL